MSDSRSPRTDIVFLMNITLMKQCILQLTSMTFDFFFHVTLPEKNESFQKQQQETKQDEQNGAELQNSNLLTRTLSSDFIWNDYYTSAHSSNYSISQSYFA